MSFNHFRMKMIAVTLFLFSIQLSLDCVSIDASSSRTHTSTANSVLLSASSPFEDLVEYAMTGNRNGVQRALIEYNLQAAEVSKALPPVSRRTMEELVASIKRAEEHSDNETIAFKSIEAYRLLMDSLDPKSLVVPIQVSMLDYEGFRLQAILHFSPNDWSEIQRTSGEAQKYWITIKPRVRNKGLADAVDTMIAGMNDAAQKKNKEMAIFASKMDLAMVDILESYFEKK